VITYAERACFREPHLRLFRRIEAYIARVSDTWGNELRCHELVRAVHLVVYEREHKLDVVDGHCGPIDHSWLRCSDGVILDVYAPGRLPAVQLVDPIVAIYRPGVRRRDVREDVVWKLVAEMRS
jgi:hypothetical protein